MNRDREELKKLRDYQKRINLAFAAYRRGNIYARDMRSKFPRAILDNVPHPMIQDRGKVAHKVYEFKTKEHMNHFIKEMKAQDYRTNKRYSMSDLNAKRRGDVQKTINLVARRLFRAGIRFRRVLSCGGMGMAALFETANSVTGLYNKCVAKVSLSEDNGHDQMEHEKNVTRLLHGAPHIVQMLSVDELRALPGGYETEAVEGVMPDDPAVCPKPQDDATVKDMVQNAKDVMILEYLPFGSLDHWIAKAEQLGLGFSNEVCWHLLLCLAKACLAMKYPTACQPKDLPVEADLDPYAPHVDTKAQHNAAVTGNNGSNSNVPAASSVSEVHNIVHFDLDPSNVLVDASNDGCGKVCANARIPKLKVADFGLAVDRSKVDLDETNFTWKYRFCGKPAYCTPEQWTAEWEAVTDRPSAAGAQIAGQYDEKTNIYQMALIMQGLMLRKSFHTAPHAGFVPVRDWRHPAFPRFLDNQAEFDRVVQVANDTKVAPQGVRMIATIAWMLDHESLRAETWASQAGGRKQQVPAPSRLYEWRLRELVMRCAAYEPYVRPTAAELVRLIEERLADGNFGAGAAEAEQLFAEVNKPEEPQPKRAYSNLIGAVGRMQPHRDAKSRIEDIFRKK
ncbi:serine/threonine protein kinase [Sporothrix schenckii ATCC 58251]|uniref:Serine/threonine protein kinase n=1 Tax=Sporothrix schenckii (strain ATCC 58251 / de Perez 2211183) TaxID=1391915 RepID=U7PV75_SPOS1|nr:serine/threonine protein kinase [Sporothrix schenckii ATCC 58251]